jgi:hypothetical protein
MPQQRNPEALDRAIVRADLTVARLKGTLRFWAALGWAQDRADHLLREAELRAEQLRHARALLTVGRDQRRTAA